MSNPQLAEDLTWLGGNGVTNICIKGRRVELIMKKAILTSMQVWPHSNVLMILIIVEIYFVCLDTIHDKFRAAQRA